MRLHARIVQFICICLLLGTITLVSSCGVYSKTPAINPDEQHWEGPLLDGTEMEDVQITIKPQQKAYIINLENLDVDSAVLMQYLRGQESQQQTFTVEEKDSYILVIKKQDVDTDSE
ncbi:MAG: hypothetical protein PWP25_885 [Sphaerochaeta sp.]|nr:hypothetical protein [Spirochaetaceae bacterium]MDK2859699.1 hypothetical protein [Sphaerochaeta sp.]MDN5333257.1 hypothetical protein [Sphaerochaeta sp.]